MNIDLNKELIGWKVESYPIILNCNDIPKFIEIVGEKATLDLIDSTNKYYEKFMK